jgi:hypothetical protein
MAEMFAEPPYFFLTFVSNHINPLFRFGEIKFERAGSRRHHHRTSGQPRTFRFRPASLRSRQTGGCRAVPPPFEIACPVRLYVPFVVAKPSSG